MDYPPQYAGIPRSMRGSPAIRGVRPSLDGSYSGLTLTAKLFPPLMREGETRLVPPTAGKCGGECRISRTGRIERTTSPFCFLIFPPHEKARDIPQQAVIAIRQLAEWRSHSAPSPIVPASKLYTTPTVLSSGDTPKKMNFVGILLNYGTSVQQLAVEWNPASPASCGTSPAFRRGGGAGCTG